MAMNNSTAKAPNSILNHLREQCVFLSDNQLQLLVDKLNAIGVEQEHDLKYLEINDLIDINIMSLIQARKVLKIMKQSTEAEVPVCEGGSFTLLQPPNSPNSSISFTASSIATSSIASMGVSDSSTDESPGPSECRSRPTCQTAWATSYSIPWEKFPKSFLTSCKNNRSPSQSDRREVVRILVDDITGVCSRPTSRDIYIVSSKLVDTYKTSLMDRFGDTRIGSGYSSFINRIQDRLNNLNRKRLSSDAGCSKSPATKRGYGWLTEAIFEEIPREEYLDSKEFLKRQARFTDVDFSLITEVMNKTYPLQREEISRGDMSIAEIEKNWPFLFTKTCALKHFEKLTGVNLPREFFVHSSSKIKTLLKYMEKLKGSRKEIKKIFEEVEEFKKITETNYPDTQCFVKLIFSYFKEDGFLEYYPQMCDQKIIEDKARTEGAPVIAVVGNLYTSTLFHVIVESKSIQVLEKLDDALLLMFAVYYILDLKYLKAASSSLEFLQRVCFGINPTRGSKGGKRKNTRNSVNAQVLQLISELRGFELDQLDS